jgi:hypothetical protein
VRRTKAHPRSSYAILSRPYPRPSPDVYLLGGFLLLIPIDWAASLYQPLSLSLAVFFLERFLSIAGLLNFAADAPALSFLDTCLLPLIAPIWRHRTAPRNRLRAPTMGQGDISHRAGTRRPDTGITRRRHGLECHAANGRPYAPCTRRGCRLAVRHMRSSGLNSSPSQRLGYRLVPQAP